VDRELKLQVNQIIRIFKIKDGGGLFWSKLSAEIPHLSHCFEVEDPGKKSHAE